MEIAYTLDNASRDHRLRLCNYKGTASAVTIEAAGRLFRTRLDEIPRAFLGNDCVSLTMGPKEILTLYLQLPVL